MSSFQSLTRQGRYKRLKKLKTEELGGEKKRKEKAIQIKKVKVFDYNNTLSETLPVREQHPPDSHDIITEEPEPEKKESPLSNELLQELEELHEPEPRDYFDEEKEEEKHLKDELRDWAVKYAITLIAITALLSILSRHVCFSDIPRDARTLLKTPRKVILRAIEPGHYFHFGLKAGILRLLKFVKETITEVNLLIGIDGLPLSKSSGKELWPILGSFWNVPSVKSVVFPIGMYLGMGKPESSEEFLSEFAEEAESLTKEGIEFEGRPISVQIKGFCTDAPAKAFILGTKGHTGYCSCTRCKVEGEFKKNRMTFKDSNCEKRTHEEFVAGKDLDYQTKKCILTRIPKVDFVKSIPLDYMHLVCLGVLRRLMYLWIFASAPIRLSFHMIQTISTRLTSLGSFIPLEINRKPRSLEEIRRWKASEFRTFLLYAGPVVLADVFSADYPQYYLNFLNLHVAITILLSKKFSRLYYKYASELLHYFVETFSKLYGSHLVTHNFHGLYHLADDVPIFGELDECSTFQFENYLQIIKRLVRKGEKQLEQIVKRLSELSESKVNYKSHERSLGKLPTPIFSKLHELGPLLEGCDPNRQYACLEFRSFRLNLNKLADSCCRLMDGAIVVVINAVYSNESKAMVVLCREFEGKKDFYGDPLMKSSQLGIYQVSSLSKDVKLRFVNEIEEKLVLLPFRDQFVVFPLVHSE